jgi:7-cyano-7-deazaguanine synthase
VSPNAAPDPRDGSRSADAAVVLLSGGLDSATALAIARERGFARFALSFRYGQRHAHELEAARRVAEHIGVVRHAIIDIDLRVFGGSALTADIPVPKDRDVEALGSEVPVTYVPARNTIFLSLALGWAEVVGANDIFIGVNAVDYSGYPDCRPEFIAAFERMANLATKAATQDGRQLTVHAPLIAMRKADIIAVGTALGVDYGLTRSCYDPDERGVACGRCDACRLRLNGFAAAGLDDPAPYAPGVAESR